ncbi:MAG: alpha/beta-type small acid-soluble spore protein [Firmicutes bacterium]|nr:alpha/beta-type small acid-soluble spore protein [Bacillota bacterium]
MAQGSDTSNKPLIQQAYNALEQFKYEVASELGINNEYQTGYWGNISSRECGAVGGHMVRRMIAAAEQSLIEQATANVKSQFQQTLKGAGFPLEPDAKTGTSSAHNKQEY